jgi:hypothetical protein
VVCFSEGGASVPEGLGKVYYCPTGKNRLVDETDGAEPHDNVENLTWSAKEQAHGKTVHLKNFPKEHRVKLFRLVVSTDRTDYVVTNEVVTNEVDQDRTYALELGISAHSL